MLAVVLVVVAAFALWPRTSDPADSPPVDAVAPMPPVTVMAVGDIACAPRAPAGPRNCRHAEVATLIKSAAPDHFIALGDLQYESATHDEIHVPGGYDETLGELKNYTLPVLGNHEILDPEGKNVGYFRYFGDDGSTSKAPGKSPDGYYTTNVGSWRFIALNSECGPDASNRNLGSPGSCGRDSEQYRWLATVLQQSKARCTLVAFHRPRWTTGAHPPYQAMAELWDLMASNGVDVTVSGHNHSSEVFRPIGPSGTGVPRVAKNGIRSFVAGGGGKDLYPFNNVGSVAGPASEARDSTTFGPLRLTLKDGGYDWGFVPLAGQSFTNVGTAGAFRGTGERCH